MALATAFLLAACGTTSTTNTTGTTSDTNPFAGTWGGRWRDDTSQYGTMRLVVASDGAVSGTVTNLVANPGTVTTGTAGGTISSTGAASLTYTFTTSRASTVYTAIGTVTKGTGRPGHRFAHRIDTGAPQLRDRERHVLDAGGVSVHRHLVGHLVR